MLALAAELQLAGLKQLLGNLAAHNPREGAHQAPFLGDVLDDEHHPDHLLLTISQRDRAEIDQPVVAARRCVAQVVLGLELAALASPFNCFG